MYLHKGPLENVYIENKELKTKLQEKVASLVKQLAQKTNEAQAYQEKNKQLTTAGVELQLKFEAQEFRFIQKTGVLKGQLEAVQNQIEVLNQELAARTVNLEKMTAERQVLTRQIDNMKEERQHLDGKNRELKHQLEKFGFKLESVSQEAISKEQKIALLNQSYEDLKMRLNKQIQEKSLEISTLENKLNIRLMNKILFSPGQTDISPNGRKLLDSLAKELKKMEGIQISVEGHTDNQPLGQNKKNWGQAFLIVVIGGQSIKKIVKDGRRFLSLYM